MISNRTRSDDPSQELDSLASEEFSALHQAAARNAARPASASPPGGAAMRSEAFCFPGGTGSARPRLRK
jgi:hypothetical protein